MTPRGYIYFYLILRPFLFIVLDTGATLFVNELLSKNSDDQQQGILQYLLGLQYQYLSDVKQANYYFNKAKKNLKGTPYHKKVKESMV